MAGLGARPPFAHIPGQNSRHPEGTFDDIRARALTPTVSATAAKNAAFQAGLDLLETGFYWESHEILEPVWMNAPANAPERFLVQALIQLANAALKQKMGRPKAALRLCAIARQHLDRAGPAEAIVMGLHVETIAGAIDRLDHALAQNRVVPIRVRS